MFILGKNENKNMFSTQILNFVLKKSEKDWLQEVVGDGWRWCLDVIVGCGRWCPEVVATDGRWLTVANGGWRWLLAT